jgi:hypothetical protein
MPVLIVGDFNCTPSVNGIMKAALDSGGWFDLHSVIVGRGREEEMACYGSPTTAPTHIDAVVGNRASFAALDDCFARDMLFPVHRAVVARLKWTVLAERGWALVRPPKVVLTKEQRKIFEDYEFQAMVDDDAYVLLGWNAKVSDMVAKVTERIFERGMSGDGGVPCWPRRTETASWMTWSEMTRIR